MKNLIKLSLLALILAGCAHQAPRAPVISEDWPKHKAQVEAYGHWQATGKLAVKVPKDGGSANLQWLQTGKDYVIHLTGPLGSGNLNITGQPGKVTLLEAGQAPQTARSAEDLIKKNTGWTIPVTQLAFWVRGLPEPGTQVTSFTPNSLGLIGELEQLGWKVSYGEYLSVTTPETTIAMPGRIVAEFKDVRLTLVVREWTFNPETKIQ